MYAKVRITRFTQRHLLSTTYLYFVYTVINVITIYTHIHSRDYLVDYLAFSAIVKTKEKSKAYRWAQRETTSRRSLKEIKGTSHCLSHCFRPTEGPKKTTAV